MLHSSITAVGDWQHADAADVTGTTAVEAVAAKSGHRHLVMAIQATNTDTAVGTIIQIRSGTTVIGYISVGPHVVLAPGTNFAQATFPKPLKGNPGENINFVCVTDSAQVRCSLQGVTVVA